MGRRRRRGRRRSRSRSRGQWSTLYAVFGTEVGGFAQFFTAIATSASGRSGGGAGAPDAKLALRIGLLRGNAVVHVAVGDFAVGATAQVVEVDGDVAVHHWLQAPAVVVVLTSLVADEEDDDDEDEQDDEGGQGADDDADVVVAVLLVLLLLVHAVRALVVCGSIQPYTAFKYRQMRGLISRVWARWGWWWRNDLACHSLRPTPPPPTPPQPSASTNQPTTTQRARRFQNPPTNQFNTPPSKSSPSDKIDLDVAVFSVFPQYLPTCLPISPPNASTQQHPTNRPTRSKHTNG